MLRRQFTVTMRIGLNRSPILSRSLLMQKNTRWTTTSVCTSQSHSCDPKHQIDFNHSQSAHASKTNLDLIRSVLVYQICRVPFIIQNANALLSLSYKILGSTITNAAVKHTFFRQFCAGQDVKSIQCKINKLKENKISAIFDYAAESDLSSSKSQAQSKSQTQSQTHSFSQNKFHFHSHSNRTNHQPARVYDYKSEQLCDFHLNTFKSCINAVARVNEASTRTSSSSFAAVKVTALGNPILLQRNSEALSEIKKLFQAFDTNNDGVLTRTEFEDGFRHYFHDSSETILPAFLEKLDSDNTKSIHINFVDFSNLLTPRSLPDLTSQLKDKNCPLYYCTPTQEEIRLMEAMYKRAHSLAELAFRSNVRLLFDAEQSYYQPCIDNLVLNLQQTYNNIEKTDIPIIFQTYQCYLKDSLSKIEMDLERSRQQNYHFGAEFVRGAYMNTECDRAKKYSYPSPIYDCIQDTHLSFDTAIENLLHYEKNNLDQNRVEIKCASHNQQSIEKTLQMMEELQTDADVEHFAQLLDMPDNLAYPLGSNGYRSYKYAPYGKLEEVIPYLMRRLEENSNVFGNAKKEQDMAWNELKRRTLAEQHV